MQEKGSGRRQIFTSVSGNLLTASFGSSFGWAAANFVELQKPDTTFPSGPLTLKQATMVVSLSFVGGIIGNLLIPHLAAKFGCKRVIFALAFPQIITWFLIIFAQNPYYLYVSNGVSGGLFPGQVICMPIMIMEISHDHIRGSLNSLMDPAFNIGTLLSFVLAHYFDYVTQAKFHLILPIAFVVLFARVPQSPQHLVNKQKLKSANKAHKFFKGTELESLPVNETKDTQDDSGLRWSDFTNHRARKAIFISFSLILLSSLQGIMILVTFVTDIFASTNPDISPIGSSSIVTAILIIANLIFINLIERAGRRTFFISSSLATAIGHTLFALYLYYLADNHAFDWAPIVCMSYVLFVSSLGMNSLPYIISIEIFPAKIKHFCYSNCILLMLVLGFLMTEFYPLVKEYIGLVGWITIFAAMSLCNGLFAMFFVPETKGKSYEAIQLLLDE